MSGFGPDDLIQCYRDGVFPMADDRDDYSIFIVDPEMRAIMPIETFKPSRSMKKFARKTSFRVTINANFKFVIQACADLRDSTWISHPLQHLYTILHNRGDAHSVEVWDGEELVGGLYGVTQGGAFFGESMFSTRTNASKLAMMHLIERLQTRGFALLDCQFMTDHLASLGAIEIDRAEYHQRLNTALKIDTDFA